jgi:hypothetical protein|tara:strand:- start:1788 stop:1985 length:198 start_codon:yes stop_codon:yes gene_type:complete
MNKLNLPPINPNAFSGGNVNQQQTPMTINNEQMTNYLIQKVQEIKQRMGAPQGIGALNNLMKEVK